MDLQDKVAAVTGAGSGIGRGIALAMAARGARVAAVDLDGKSAEETARLLMGAGGKGMGGQADTSRAADVDRAVATAVGQLGPLDVMVNNAGILDGYFNVDETDDAVWARVLGINLTGVFFGCKRALKEMLPRGTGRIINMASVAGLNGTGGGAAYVASKHGVVGLMRSYANNLAPHSIRVNTVHPTGVNTPMVVNDAMQEFLAADPSLSDAMANALPVPMVEPVDISNAILWLVSDDARYVTGVTLPVDAGFTNKK